MKLRKTLVISLLLVILLAGGVAWYVERMRSSGPGVTPDRDRYPIRGIDISAHNGVIDFETVAQQGIDFVIIKASEGATFRDKRFVDNMRRARKAGLRLGAYHFFRFDVSGHLQALNLLHQVQGRSLDFPLAIDVESWTNPSNVPETVIAQRLEEMVSYLEQRGYNVMIYTNKKGLDKYLKKLPSEHNHLWICSFNDPPLDNDRTWTLWQHTHRGRIEGIDGVVDVNTFNGSRNDFDRWLLSISGQ